MTNFLYAYPVIFDNEGRPLDGRLDFFEPGTSTPKNVLDVDGNPLGTSIDTTAAGFVGTDQIFIDGNTDCKVYRGEALQYTMRLIDTTSQSGSSASGSVEVGSVSDLRDLAIPEDGTIVTLTGRYEPGDMTAQTYVYSEDSEAFDDGASVIQPDDEHASTSGRWLLIPGRLIDCRLFGIMPSDDTTTLAASSLTSLFIYCNSVRRDAWFPAIETNLTTCYAFTAGAYTLHGKVVVDSGVHFRNSLTTNSVTLVVDGGFESTGFKFDYGTFNVTSPVFRTSWIGTATVSYSPTELLKVDASAQVVASGVNVEFLTTVNASVNLTSCNISCLGKLSTLYAHSFTNCRVSDRFWTDPSSINVNLVGLYSCIFDIDEFASTDNWAKFNIKQGNNVLDFGGRAVSSLSFAASSVEVDNARISSLVLQNSVEIAVVRDCVVNSFTWGAGNVSFERCTVNVLSDISQTSNVLTFRDGSLTTGSTPAEITVDTANLINSSIECDIRAKALFAFDCVVTGTLTSLTKENGQSIKFHEFQLIGNVFAGAGKHVVDSQTGNFLSICVWKNNHFGGANPGIVINESHFALTQNTYSYEGNTGNVLPTSVKDIVATSYTVSGSDEGWIVSANFTGKLISLFLVGSKKVRTTVHVDVTGDVFGTLCGFSVHEQDRTVQVDSITGSLLIYMPDITNPVGSKLKDVASGGGARVYADVEVL